ncbi:MAG: hypothetical protein HWE27_10285 [Gammaproteobacteria bacterium]|nr:hypothetical protein [Gammaproteobacteria bacterium]
MKQFRTFHLALIIGIWAIAQQAMIDHVYSDAHNNDTVCEWCTNHSNVKDTVVTNTVEPIVFVTKFDVPSLQVSLATRSKQALRPPPRAPPHSTFI